MSRTRWVQDAMHFPSPLTPLTASIETSAFERGFDAAAAELDTAAAVRVRVIDHRWYQASRPRPGADGCELRRRQRDPRAWFERLLSEIGALNEALRREPEWVALDHETAVARATELRTRAWAAHFLAVGPAMAAVNEYVELYERLARSSGVTPFELLTGIDGSPARRVLELHALARELEQIPRLRRALAAGDGSAAAALAREPRLDAALGGFLDEFGWVTGGADFSLPAWRDDPRPVYALLCVLVRHPELDPGRAQREARDRGAHVAAAVLGGLAGHPELPALRASLHAAEEGLYVLEEHAFHLDQMNTALMRLPLIRIGGRLAAAGTLDRADDVFFLRPGELAARPRRRPSGLVAERRTSWERSWLDPRPSRLDPAGADPDPRAARFFGTPTRQPASGPLHGRPAAAGTAEGIVKLVHSVPDVATVGPSTIVVCTSAHPTWTPLLAGIAGLVADTGGELSHSAILAREYGIPCVVGTGSATTLLRDGDIVAIDGAAGTVELRR